RFWETAHIRRADKSIKLMIVHERLLHKVYTLYNDNISILPKQGEVGKIIDGKIRTDKAF
ncbi:MAG: hypothetical protein LUH19_06705, partial [Lachnospiraceae bacterium]|nr:hypothetical protein [Lachnospiraceae bacterium]